MVLQRIVCFWRSKGHKRMADVWTVRRTPSILRDTLKRWTNYVFCTTYRFRDDHKHLKPWRTVGADIRTLFFSIWCKHVWHTFLFFSLSTGANGVFGKIEAHWFTWYVVIRSFHPHMSELTTHWYWNADMQFRREDGTIVVRVKSYIPAKIVADTNAHICFSLFYTDHGLEEYVFILAKIAVERPCLTCVFFVQGARGSPKRHTVVSMMFQNVVLPITRHLTLSFQHDRKTWPVSIRAPSGLKFLSLRVS